jgi:peptide/nickel transport system substrate-binding protein
MALAAGCETGEGAAPEETPPESPTLSAPTPTPTPRRESDSRFTIRYDPDAALNPFTGTNADNMAVASLMYEGLFSLDESFSPVPVLCESFTSEDSETYVFTIKRGVIMADGGELTADDVAYSLDYARSLPKYSVRLGCIEAVSAVDGEMVAVELGRANNSLPALLDVPIVRSGTADLETPVGSGPYVLSDAGGDASLTALPGYRDREALLLRVIYLRSCTDAELVELFSDYKIDLYRNDPTGLMAAETRRDHEIRYYDTTTLQYLGFSARLPVMRDPELRRAIALCVDREHIVKDIMSGCALTAPLVLSPAYHGYDAGWDTSPADPFLEISEMFSRLGLTDSDSDLFLEYPASDAGYTPFSLDFIVNSENRRKTEAAASICDAMRRVGLDVTLRALPWDEFTKALEDGDFDIYYGETALPADFDITELVTPGGALDYGGVGSDDCGEYIEAFLAAKSETQRGVTARHLCEKINRDAITAPILYKQYAVHTGRNVISGMRPTQSSVFFGLTGWKIELGRL